MFTVATGSTISCSLGWQYKLMLSLSFFDVYVPAAYWADEAAISLAIFWL
jgi:hypothetical protein